MAMPPSPPAAVTPAASVSVPVPAAPLAKPATPEGCKKLATDADWPSDAEWKQALPEVVARSSTLAKGVARPDYRVRAESYADVQAAVKFAARNNIRLTVINSGHDFVGRNDAPSGLSLDVSLLGGITLHEEFVATATGAAKPARALNTIVPVPGKQHAVTFGVGVTSQKLHNAVSPSKLVTIGAAHGANSPKTLLQILDTYTV
jgi:FAD/FMN-containing dehydrogenase